MNRRAATVATAIGLLLAGVGCARDAYRDASIQPLGVEARGDDLLVRFWAMAETMHWCPGADLVRRPDGTVELTFIRARTGTTPPVDLPARDAGGRQEVVVPGGAHGKVVIADGRVLSHRR